MGKKVIYAIYKGDVFVDLGTKEELAERMKVRPDTITFWASDVNLKRIQDRKIHNRGGLLAIRIGKLGDELDESRDSTKATKLKWLYKNV